MKHDTTKLTKRPPVDDTRVPVGVLAVQLLGGLVRRGAARGVQLPRPPRSAPGGGEDGQKYPTYYAQK